MKCDFIELCSNGEVGILFALYKIRSINKIKKNGGMNKMTNNYDQILIEIYDGTNRNCESGCSTHGLQSDCAEAVPVEELVKNAAIELHKSFGASVKIKYINTDSSGMNELCRKIIEAGHRFPITVIDGQPRIAGAFNLNLIKQGLNEIAFRLINEINQRNIKN